jgi:hypothetical protein
MRWVRRRRRRRGSVSGGSVLTVYSIVVGEGRRVCSVGGQVSILDAWIAIGCRRIAIRW